MRIPPQRPPNPPSTTAAGTTVTSYLYDLLNHLTVVSMPRTVSGSMVTQTRHFNYDATTQRLTSSDNPESGPSGSNGITQYAYNADGTVYTRTDPKGQVTTYSYDSYQRVIQVTHGSDATQTVFYTYNSDPLDTNSSFSHNTFGRVGLVQWGGMTCSGTAYTYSEEFSYDVAGENTAKRVTKMKGVCRSVCRARSGIRKGSCRM